MTSFDIELRIVEADGRPLATTCLFAVHVDGFPIWPARNAASGGMEIQVDDLLSHLTEYWKPLLLRQTYPLAINLDRPSELEVEARRRWEDKPESQVVAEDELLEAFRDCHDLSRCLAGYFDLPPLWFVRSGDEMLVDAAGRLERVPYDDARLALESAGQWIAERLAKTGDERWNALLAAWKRRDAADGISLLRWATGLDECTVAHLTADGLLHLPVSMADAANDTDELWVAARMASALPAIQVRRILERVHRFDARPAPLLDEIATRVRKEMEAHLMALRPFEQGLKAAMLVRSALKLVADEAVDILAIAQGLGPEICCEELGPDTLDALTIWGRRHGPAILLNIRSVRHQGAGDFWQRGQVRATLAHEICHLVLDSAHGVSAVDVLHSQMPVRVEQRARAFAGEFLLPSGVAAQRWIDAGSPRERPELEAVLSTLCQDFAVSHSLAAWKLQHGASTEGADLSPMLNLIVPQR